MFQSKKKKYDIYQMQETEDEYGQTILTPVFFKTVEMFISLAQFNAYTANDFRLQEVTHTAITNDRQLKKGMLIEKKYRIEFVNDAGPDVLLYLKEVE